MPTDTAATDSASQKPAGDPAARLQEICARVAERQRRIKTERDPKAVAELRAEVGKLGELISELVSAAGNGGQVAKTGAAWPADLNHQPESHGARGPDPTEVAGA